MTAPKPRPDWGRWRNEVVTQHANRSKVSTKQTELEDQLREGNDNLDNDTRLPTNN